jgi:hypothetical protein
MIFKSSVGWSSELKTIFASDEWWKKIQIIFHDPYSFIFIYLISVIPKLSKFALINCICFTYEIKRSQKV